MKPTSPHTKDLIQGLHEPVSLREKLTGSRNYEAILSAIGDSNEPAAIIEILPFTRLKDETGFAAAAAVHKLLLGTTQADMAWLDAALRQHSTFSVPNFYDRWFKMSAAQNWEF